MSKPQYEKVALFAILMGTIFAIGVYQQALAGSACDYYDGCYNYPQQKSSIQTVLSQSLRPDNTGTITSI